MAKLYLIGSLRNTRIPELANRLRGELPNTEVFDDWYSAGPEADDYWKSYEQGRGRSYREALEGYSAKHVFEFDKHHLDTSSHILLVLPAGKSGHMEAMYGKYGAGKPTAILLDPTDVRWDVMYQFIPDILHADEEVKGWMERTDAQVGPAISGGRPGSINVVKGPKYPSGLFDCTPGPHPLFNGIQRVPEGDERLLATL